MTLRLKMGLLPRYPMSASRLSYLAQYRLLSPLACQVAASYDRHQSLLGQI